MFDVGYDIAINVFQKKFGRFLHIKEAGYVGSPVIFNNAESSDFVRVSATEL